MSDNLPRMDYRQHRPRRLVHGVLYYDEGNCLLLDDRGALRMRPEHFPFPHVPLVPCGCPAP